MEHKGALDEGSKGRFGKEFLESKGSDLDGLMDAIAHGGEESFVRFLVVEVTTLEGGACKDNGNRGRVSKCARRFPFLEEQEGCNRKEEEDIVCFEHRSAQLISRVSKREATTSEGKKEFNLIVDGPNKAQTRDGCALSVFSGLDPREMEKEQLGGVLQANFAQGGPFGLEDGDNNEIKDDGNIGKLDDNGRDVLGKERKGTFGNMHFLSFFGVYDGEGFAKLGLECEGTLSMQKGLGSVGSSEKRRKDGCNAESLPVVVEETPLITTRSRDRVLKAVAQATLEVEDRSVQLWGGGDRHHGSFN